MQARIKLIDNKPSVWLAHRFFLLEQYDMCLNVVDQILKKSPDNPEALSLKGSILRTKGKIDEALNCFQTASYMDSKNIRHKIEIVRCLYFLGRFHQSLTILNEIKKSGEGNIWEVDHLIGSNYLRLRKYDEAIEAFESALDADFRVETVLEILSAYEAKKDFASMHSIIKESLAKHSSNASLRFKVAKFLLGQNILAEAQVNFEFVYKKDKTNFQAMLYSASIRQSLSKIAEALPIYRQAFVGLKNSAGLWNNVSLCMSQKNKTEASISCCKRSLTCAPFEPLPLANMGLSYLELEMYCSAACALKRAVLLDPSLENAGEGLGVALMNLGEYKEALKYLNNEMQKSFGHRISINTAICYYRAGMKKEAIETFKRFQKLIVEEPALEASYPMRKAIAGLFSEEDPKAA